MPKIDADHDDGNERDTQRRLRPLMVGMLIALTVFFFVVTLTQLIDLNHRINQSPEVNLASLLAPTPCPAAASTQQCDDYRRMNIAVTLEVNLVARRHHQANVMLMASIWSRYLGFIMGMVLALIGAAFIVGHGSRLLAPRRHHPARIPRCTRATKVSVPRVYQRINESD